MPMKIFLPPHLSRSRAAKGTHPYYVSDFHIVCEIGLISVVQVDYCRLQRLVDSEEIKPCAVLAELVAVIFILGRSLSVSDKQSDAPLALGCTICHLDHQCLPPSCLNILAKHIVSP